MPEIMETMTREATTFSKLSTNTNHRKVAIQYSKTEINKNGTRKRITPNSMVCNYAVLKDCKFVICDE